MPKFINVIVIKTVNNSNLKSVSVLKLVLGLLTLLFLLIISQGVLAQNQEDKKADDFTCFFFPDDPKCADFDTDGYANYFDSAVYDPCKPDSDNAACSL